MKATYLVIIGCLALCLNSCKQASDAVTLNQTSIVGKWHIIVDSTSTGAGMANAFATYTGQPGDYFGFADNGYIYIKEGAKLDSSSYQYFSDSSIIIHSFVYFANSASYPISHIKTNGANSMKIYLPWLISPGGAFGRSITLSK